MNNRRKEQRDYEADVFYDVWKRGGNPDRVNNERVIDHFWNGDSVDRAVKDELERQRPKPEIDGEEFEPEQ